MIARRDLLAGMAVWSAGLARGAPPTSALSRATSIVDFGADLVSPFADHTLAFQRAIASRRPVFLPPLTAGRAYRVSQPLHDTGGANIIGLGNMIDVVNSDTFLNITGVESIWSGLSFTPRQRNRQYGIVITSDARSNTLEDLVFISGNSGLRIEGQGNIVRRLSFYEMKGTSVRLDGENSTLNSISDILIRNGALAGILHDNGAHHNTVSRARKWVDLAHLPAGFTNEPGVGSGHLGGDVCAFAASAHHNHVRDVSCVGARDGCFTISGDDNELVGATFLDGLASGCAISGSRNKISNVRVERCKTGFRVIPQAGGLAKDNLFMDCSTTGSVEYGFRIDADAYRKWQANVTKEPATHFCTYNRSVYRTPHAINKFGSIAPTHRSGAASDGLTTWTFVAHDPVTLDADCNTAIRCTSQGAGTANWTVHGSGTFILKDCSGHMNGPLRSA